MIFLPVVDRELRSRSRMPGTYWVRVGAGLAAFVILALMMLQSRRLGAGFAGGEFAFKFMAGLAMIYCLFEGARVTSDAISEEKREGTLGLLFLTDLKGHDVVFGKLAASSLNSFYGLLAIVPMFAIPVLMGGVTGSEVGRMSLALGNTLFLSLAVGLWVSARSYDAHRAAKSTIFILLLLAIGPVLLDQVVSRSGPSRAIFSVVSPGFASYMAYEGSVGTIKSSPARFSTSWLFHGW